jgi:hypothetical protein
VAGENEEVELLKSRDWFYHRRTDRTGFLRMTFVVIGQSVNQFPFFQPVSRHSSAFG